MTVSELPAQSYEGTYSFQQAVRSFRENAQQRRDALKRWSTAIKLAGAKERDYRKAYARAIVEAEGTEKVREAVAKAVTAVAEAERNIARDMVAVAKEEFRMLEGERANINGLVDWSKRLEPGVGG